MSNEGRWILMSDGTSQMMYAGLTILSEEAIDEAIMMNRPIELTECRAVRTFLTPSPQGIGQNEIMSPVGIARAGIRMKVKAAAYFWPDEEELTKASFMKQLDACNQSEAQHRAAAAGIVAPSRVRITPGGKMNS